jgi:hypothetical protein
MYISQHYMAPAQLHRSANMELDENNGMRKMERIKAFTPAGKSNAIFRYCPRFH